MQYALTFPSDKAHSVIFPQLGLWYIIFHAKLNRSIIVKRRHLIPDLLAIQYSVILFGRVSHYSDVIMSTMASQITSLTIIYSTFYSGADQRKLQSSASLAFERGIHRYSPHKGPVTWKMFLFDDVIMLFAIIIYTYVSLHKLFSPKSVPSEWVMRRHHWFGVKPLF